LKSATLRSDRGGSCVVQYGSRTLSLQARAGETIRLDGALGTSGRDVPEGAAGDRSEHPKHDHPPHDASCEEPGSAMAHEGLDVLRPRRRRGV
jgi:hypothetical protein